MKIIVMIGFVAIVAAPLRAQIPEYAYETVLQHIGEEYPENPIVLNNTIANIQCMPRGGCPEPWAGTFRRDWLEHLRARGIIGDFCVSFGSCSATAGPRPPWAVQVLLSTASGCGEGGFTIKANHMVPQKPDSAVRGIYMVYTLVSTSTGWRVASAVQVGSSYINE